jgi:hypothetical protein
MSSVGLSGRSGVGAPLPNPTGKSPRAAVPAPGAPPRPAGAKSKVRAAAPVSNARAEASRKNGARSRGPKTAEGKARAAQNALKHGMRAEKHVILPDEDGAEFAALEAEMIEELAPAGALQAMLARRVAVAAWRLARADRIELGLFAERSYGADANPGLAMIRDGNGTRSFETLLRYRGAAMAEFWRALKTLKALQAEQAAATLAAVATPSAEIRPMRPAIQPALGPQPNEPERGAARLECALAELPAPARTLHEPAAPWLPKEPEAVHAPHAAAPPASRTNPTPGPNAARPVCAQAGRGRPSRR